MRHKNRVTSVAFAPDGTGVVAAGYDALILWTLDGEERWRFGSGDLWRASFTPDGKTVIAGGFNRALVEIDARTGKQRRAFAAPSANVFSLAVSPDGARFVVGCRPEVELRDTASGAVTSSFAAGKGTKAHVPTVSAAAFSPNGKRVAVVCGKKLTVADVATGAITYAANVDRFGAAAVVFADDDTVVTGGTDAALAFRDVRKVKVTKAARTLASQSITALARSPDGRTLVAGGGGAVCCWDIASGERTAELGRYTQVDDVAVSADGKHAAAACESHVALWELA